MRYKFDLLFRAFCGLLKLSILIEVEIASEENSGKRKNASI